MQNGQTTVREILYAPCFFAVPPYQRAYSWEDKHLQDFLRDLKTQRMNRPYFLGAVLLEKQTREGLNAQPVGGEVVISPPEGSSPDEAAGAGFEEYQIVDGQQRLTTLTVFLAVAVAILETRGYDDRQLRLWRRLLKEEGEEKFRTIPSDGVFFSTYILGRDEPPTSSFDTPSQRRLWAAKTFFRSELQVMESANIAALLRTLETAKILVYAVENKVDAAQIFELNNDRGKKLTSLESIKSFLMYLALLHSKNPERLIAHTQAVFEEILRIAEDCDELGSDLNEDSILRYHFVAFERWTESQYDDPKQLIKDTVQTLNSEAVCEWVRSFCARLLESFKISWQLILLGKTDCEVGDLFALGRIAPFLPLLLKTYKGSADERADFRRVARLLEIFSFRAYGIADVRANMALSSLYVQARDFCGDFETLVTLLKQLCSSFWDVERRFFQALETDFYKQGADARYFLWKYENHLRSTSFPPIPLQDFVSKNSRWKFSIEHIAAQKVDQVDSSKIELAGRNEEFSGRWLHSIGNLVLDTHSDNACKGNDPFFQKLAHYEQTPLKSQLELEAFARKDESGALIWDADTIFARGQVLISFARKHWDPASV
jgi:hypothetical protein